MDTYEIHVAGQVAPRRASALGCGELRLLPDDSSVLVFAAVDQAALYGLLGRLRDAGLELIAAERIPAPHPHGGGVDANTTSKEASDATR